jgi:hypothetical protein
MLECKTQSPNLLQYQTSHFYGEVDTSKYRKYFYGEVDTRKYRKYFYDEVETSKYRKYFYDEVDTSKYYKYFMTKWTLVNIANISHKLLIL